MLFELEDKVKIFKDYSNEFNNSLIKVFIIDPAIKSHKGIADFLDKLPHSYFTIIDNPEAILSQYNSKNYFTSGCSLIALINTNQAIILQSIKEHDPSLVLKPWDINKEHTFFSENILYHSNYTETNYFILNQIIGNFWIEDGHKVNNLDYTENKLPSKKRIEHILGQVEVIDALTDLMYSNKIAKLFTINQPVYPTLILIAPYYFPRLRKLLKKEKLDKRQKATFNVSNSEQNLDYEFLVAEHNNLTKEEVLSIMASICQRLLFIDYIGYLHALLSYSPVIRLPIIGKSINLELSQFESSFSKNSQTVTNIFKFGQN
ncbi:MAG: hypothetical protein IPL42_17485 [Saprospiraceae bacterium]|nr:hypothetical protein [Saprospiraceae bacterium]